ncbi:Der1-like protein, partial [Tilletiaria anomala UBC 951]
MKLNSRKIPPVTRTMLGLALGMTLPCTLSIMSPYRIALYWPLVSRHPISEFYRLFTAFFYAGRGISMILDIYFLFRNGNDLESNKFFRKTSNYVWALLLTATMILVLNYPLGSFFLWKPLLMSLTYLWARANPHARVSFFGFFTIVASYLPYVQLVLDLVVGSVGLAVQSATGLVAAYLYEQLAEATPADAALPVPAWL